VPKIADRGSRSSKARVGSEADRAIKARIAAVSADLMPTPGTGRDLEKRPV